MNGNPLAEALFRVRMTVEGARAVVLVGKDGMVVAAAAGDGDDSLDALAATFGDLFRRARMASREALLALPDEMTLTSESGTVLLRKVSEDCDVVLVLEPGTLLGRARWQFRSAAEQLRQIVEG